MKKNIGDNFGEVEKYKLYRTVYEILHPTISKKNISNYKVVFDEKILPVLVYYPTKISNTFFVVNQGSMRYYIQVVYDMTSEEKQAQELNSLRNIPDSFKKIVIEKRCAMYCDITKKM